MAGRNLKAVKKAVALVAATPKTVIQLLAGNAALRLLRLTLGFTGTSNTDGPALVELVRQTSAGTMTALALVLADNGITYTPLASASHTASAEPTDASDVPFSDTVHPQTSISFPFSDTLEDDIVKEATRIGLRITATANTTVTATLIFEE